MPFFCRCLHKHLVAAPVKVLQHPLPPFTAVNLPAGAFREDNFQKAVAALTDVAGDANGKKGGKKGKGGTTVQGDKEKSDIFKLVRASISSFCKLTSCNQSCCNLPFQRERLANVCAIWDRASWCFCT